MSENPAGRRPSSSRAVKFGIPTAPRPDEQDATPSAVDLEDMTGGVAPSQEPPAAPVPDEQSTPVVEKPAVQPAASPTEEQTRAPAPRRVTTNRAPTTPRAPVAPVPDRPNAHGPVREVDLSAINYELTGDEPKVRDTSSKISSSLPAQIALAQALWTAENIGAFGYSPNESAFREALIRMGLKHLNDPDFIKLIPADRRRRS